MESSSSDVNSTSVVVDSSPTSQKSSFTTDKQQPGSADLKMKSSTSMDRPLTDIISERFAPFDAQTLIAQPFENEAGRSAKFEEELCGMLLNVLLETHAWASARPKHEAALEGRLLEDQIAQIMDTEREQEQTRQRLGEFVNRMKKALAALTGAAF